MTAPGSSNAIAAKLCIVTSSTSLIGDRFEGCELL
jgi:hypothetical protein